MRRDSRDRRLGEEGESGNSKWGQSPPWGLEFGTGMLQHTRSRAVAKLSAVFTIDAPGDEGFGPFLFLFKKKKNRKLL